jgi:hypothetical protein
MCWKRGDVLDLQELEAVLEQMEMLQAMSESLREQQFQAIPELGVELLPNITTVICNTYHPLIPSGLCTRRLRENWLQHNTHERKSESTSKTCRATTNLAQQNRQQRAHPSPKHPT